MGSRKKPAAFVGPVGKKLETIPFPADIAEARQYVVRGAELLQDVEILEEQFEVDTRDLRRELRKREKALERKVSWRVKEAKDLAERALAFSLKTRQLPKLKGSGGRLWERVFPQSVQSVDEEKFYGQVRRLGSAAWKKFVKITKEPVKSALRDPRNAELVSQIPAVLIDRTRAAALDPTGTKYRLQKVLGKTGASWERVLKKNKKQKK